MARRSVAPVAQGRARLLLFVSVLCLLVLGGYFLFFSGGKGERHARVGGRHARVTSIGQPKYQLAASTYFDSFGVPQYSPWIKEHVSAILAYPPFGDRYVELSNVPVLGYHDPATEGEAPLGSSGIHEYVSRVRHDMNRGYAGVYVDDANWTFDPSPGPNSALANLLEAIRAAEPKAVIEINSQYHDIWPLMKSKNADVERALSATNIVDKEFGVGPTAAITTAQDYDEFLQYVDALHSKGIGVNLAGDHLSEKVATMEYNLATYFLITNGRDYVSGVNQTPEDFWSGFEVNLGNPRSARQRSRSGLWTRSFTRGRVYTVEPEGAAQTIKLGRPMHSAEWGTVESLTLKAGEGAVLVG